MSKRFLFTAALAFGVISINATAVDRIVAGKAAAEKFNCAACHGADYDSPTDPSFPKLAGQHRDYLEMAMIGYKRGGEGPNGRANAIMAGQVDPLSRDDIRNIAAYLNSLPGSLVLRK